MDAARVRALIDGGETLTTEFKTKVDDKALVEAITCLANGSGGTLLVGVKDDGTVVGSPPRHGNHTDPDRLRALIAGRTDPSLVTAIDIVTIDGKEVLSITTPPATSVTGTADGKFLRRTIDISGAPQCLPMRAHEVVSRAGAIGEQDISRVVIPDLTMDDLSRVEMDRFRSLAATDGDEVLKTLSDEELLTALGVSGPDRQLTVGALLLFGEPAPLSRFVPSHEVGFQELENLEVRTNELRRLPLIRAMVELSEQIRLRNREQEIDVGPFRVGVPPFATAAVRELVANALVHRDYTRMGTALVQLENGNLTISNPGGLPEGITTANFLTAPPHPRNPILADAFKRAGLVERTGRGINRVYYAQLELGHPTPDYHRTTATSVVARLRSMPTDVELAAFVAELQRDGQTFSLQDLQALKAIREEGRITSAIAAELFQVSNEDARAELNRLVRRQILETRGDGRSRTYHLAASVYARLNEAGEYKRARGIDEAELERRIMNHIIEHGSITRKETSDLGHIPGDQASRMLRRLRDEGKLEQRGERRGTHYVLPGSV